MKSLQFNAFTKQQDGAGYCSEVETFAENMVEGDTNDATIFFPGKGKWASARSTTYRRTADGSAIILPLGIYKVLSVKLYPKNTNMVVSQTDGTSLSWENYIDSQGNVYKPDITKYVYEQTEWDALTLDDVNRRNPTPRKINSLYYTKGSNVIQFSGAKYRTEYGAETPIYENLIWAVVHLEEAQNYYAKGNQSSYTTLYNRIVASADPGDWEFQIEYIPVSPSIKMKAHKAEKMPVKYAQIVNQRAEVNNADAFGKYLHTTAQKTGTEKLSIAKTYTKIADVPPIGSVVWHKGERYRLMANTWTITNPVVFTVTHLLSKNWSSKSKHIAVDQKYRNWNIPFDDYVWRTVYYEEFVELSGRSKENDSRFDKLQWADAIKALFSIGEQQNKVLQCLWLEKYTKLEGEISWEWEGCVLPVSTQGIGKSLVFGAVTKDTLSAGLRVNPNNTEYCEEVLYCNADGTLDRLGVRLAPTVESYNMDAYPYACYKVGSKINVSPYHAGGNQYFVNTFALDKDPGEAIKVTVQLHFIPTENWIVVGNKLAQDHPFVSNKARAGFKIWRLKEYIRDGVDKIVVNVWDNGNNYLTLDTDAAVSAFIKCDGKSVRVAADMDGYKAWAITDLDDNLYLGSNDVTKKEIFINLTRSR